MVESSPVFADGFGRRVVRVGREDAPVELLQIDPALAEHPGFADALRERVAKLAEPAPHLLRPGAAGRDRWPRRRDPRVRVRQGLAAGRPARCGGDREPHLRHRRGDAAAAPAAADRGDALQPEPRHGQRRPRPRAPAAHRPGPGGPHRLRARPGHRHAGLDTRAPVDHPPRGHAARDRRAVASRRAPTSPRLASRCSRWWSAGACATTSSPIASKGWWAAPASAPRPWSTPRFPTDCATGSPGRCNWPRAASRRSSKPGSRSNSCWPPRSALIAQPMELDGAMARLDRLMPAFELPTPPAAPPAPPLFDMPAPNHDWVLPAVAFDRPAKPKAVPPPPEIVKTWQTSMAGRGRAARAAGDRPLPRRRRPSRRPQPAPVAAGCARRPPQPDHAGASSQRSLPTSPRRRPRLPGRDVHCAAGQRAGIRRGRAGASG